MVKCSDLSPTLEPHMVQEENSLPSSPSERTNARTHERTHAPYKTSKNPNQVPAFPGHPGQTTPRVDEVSLNAW